MNQPDEAVERERRRRRRAAIFGDVLPDATSDDADEADADNDRSSDDWLRGQKPPHHG